MNNDGFRVDLSDIRGGVIDVADTPDAVPVMSVICALAKGESMIINTARLRAKESDRVESVTGMLRALGVDCVAGENEITIRGTARISGGKVDSCNDHRIAMSAAVAATYSESPVVICGAESVNKSYPSFWDDFVKLGGRIDVEHSGK